MSSAAFLGGRLTITEGNKLNVNFIVGEMVSAGVPKLLLQPGNHLFHVR